MTSINKAIKDSNEIDKAFFDKAFANTETPENLRRLAARLCRSYGIRGICDPMYIANVIACELGIGDGHGNFNETKS